jgi:hypothetical protein
MPQLQIQPHRHHHQDVDEQNAEVDNRFHLETLKKLRAVG